MTYWADAEGNVRNDDNKVLSSAEIVERLNRVPLFIAVWVSPDATGIQLKMFDNLAAAEFFTKLGQLARKSSAYWKTSNVIECMDMLTVQDVIDAYAVSPEQVKQVDEVQLYPI